MITAGKSSRLPFVPPFFYGWVIVFISALSIFFSGPGQTYSVSVFIDSYISEYGWSRSFVSSLYSFGTLAAGFGMAVIGRQIDRRGHRTMMPIIAAAFAAATFWMSIVIHPLMLFIGFFSIRLLGQGSMTLAGSTLAPQWFERKRGRAMSLMALGGVIGAAALPPFNAWLIETWSWQVGWRFWTVALLAIMVPLGRFLVRNRPESVGLNPDGAPPPKDGEEDTYRAVDSWTLRQARRTRTFWLFMFCQFVPSMVNTGITFHIVSILGEQGITRVQSSFVLGLIALVALPCTFAAGYILDRFLVHRVMTITNIFQVLVMVWLLMIENYPMAVAFGVLRGMVQGFEMMNFNVMWPNYFGRLHLGSLRGFAMIFMVAGSAFGPLPFGFAFDMFGGYTEIIVLMTLFPVLSIVAAALARPPRLEEIKK